MSMYVAVADPRESLTHYGVLGMKWGIRKDGRPQGYQGKGTKSKVEKFSNTNIPRKTKETSWTEDMKAVNPQRNTKNCGYCSTAYDLRRRGYDVRAASTSIGISDDVVTELYPGAKMQKVKAQIKDTSKYADHDAYQKDPAAYRQAKKDNAVAVEKELSKQPEGARGNILVNWEGGMGGHSMAYEIQNGKPKLIDAQIGEVVSFEKVFNKVSPSKEVTFIRTDNVEPDLKKIADAGIIKAKGVKKEKITSATRKEFQKDLNKSSEEHGKDNPEAIYKDLTKKHSAVKIHQIMRKQQDIDNAKAIAAVSTFYVAAIALPATLAILESKYA